MSPEQSFRGTMINAYSFHNFRMKTFIFISMCLRFNLQEKFNLLQLEKSNSQVILDPKIKNIDFHE